MTQVCKEANEAAAEATQAAALVSHLSVHNDNPAYTAGTTRWAIPKQRTDGKWTTGVCPLHNYAGKTLIDYDAGDYPVVEEA